MPTDLPTNVDVSYPDTTDAEKLHQQHHDAIHGYTNTHDGATDPHGDRAHTDAAEARLQEADTNHRDSATTHTAMRGGLLAVVREVGGAYGARPLAADVPNVLWIGKGDATLLDSFVQWNSTTGAGDTWQQVPA